MAHDNSSVTEDREAVDAYVAERIEAGRQVRIPDVMEIDDSSVVYRVADRCGVSVTVVPNHRLSEEQLTKILTYRMAQYLAVNFVDVRRAWQDRLQHEPLDSINDGDLHVIAASSETGEILCYATIEASPVDDPSITLRDEERELLPAERVHGWGVFNRLRILPDLPLSKIRELGRFVKNQRLHTFDELGARSAVEVCVALFRSLAGPLRLDVDAIVGDLEEGVAKQNLEFFHAPLVVIHGTVPYLEEASYLFPRYQLCTVYPFAVLSSDVSKHMLERLDAIEKALEQPGKQGLLALFALKRDAYTPQSGLIPRDGMGELSTTRLDQEGRPMPERWQLIDMADQLRQTDLLSGLSVAEAAVLGTFMERVEVPEGEAVVRQGELSDSLYVIEAGEAEVRAESQEGDPVTVARLGRGDFFGEIALLTGQPRMADVVAASPMTLLQLTREAYTRYLGHAVEVEQNITRTALTRTRETAQRISTDKP